MFFDEHASRLQYTPDDLVLATRLRKAVRGLRPSVAPNMDKWAGALAVLTRRHGVQPVQLLMDWYVANIGKPYVPAAWSAKAFKAKYEDIEAARQRDEQATPVPTTAVGAKICHRLEMMHWPKKSRDKLPQAVERHLLFWDVWLAQARKTAADITTQADMLPEGLQRAKQSRKARRVCVAVETFGTTAGFVAAFFSGYNRKISNWADWSGTFPSPTLAHLKQHHSWNSRSQGFMEINDGN